jgi:hypothetical protein
MLRWMSSCVSFDVLGSHQSSVRRLVLRCVRGWIAGILAFLSNLSPQCSVALP